MHAFDIKTGEKLWSYYLGDAGYDTPYGHYPLETPMIVADGKVYTSAGHGYSPPIFKGATMMGIDAETGELIWDILFFGDRMGMAVADGYLISYNIYMMVKCIASVGDQAQQQSQLTQLSVTWDPAS